MFQASNYRELLCCPVCFNSLRIYDSISICKQCERQYHSMQGIPDFYVASQNEQTEKISQINSKYYDNTAEKYESMPAKSKNIAGGLLKSKFVKDIFNKQSYHRVGEIVNHFLPENGICLDVGCGTGNILRNDLIKSKNRLGIDISINMLLEAEKSGYPVVRANNYKTPFMSDTFDMICASSVMHHMADLDLFFHEMARVLKPGGIMYTDSDPNPVVLAIKSQHRLYSFITKSMKAMIHKESLFTDVKSGIPRERVDYQCFTNTQTSDYQIEKLCGIILKQFGIKPALYYHINNQSIFNANADKGSLLNRMRRKVLHYADPTRELATCGEYLLMIITKGKTS